MYHIENISQYKIIKYGVNWSRQIKRRSDTMAIYELQFGFLRYMLAQLWCYYHKIDLNTFFTHDISIWQLYYQTSPTYSTIHTHHSDVMVKQNVYFLRRRWPETKMSRWAGAFVHHPHGRMPHILYMNWCHARWLNWFIDSLIMPVVDSHPMPN